MNNNYIRFQYYIIIWFYLYCNSKNIDDEFHFFLQCNKKSKYAKTNTVSELESEKTFRTIQRNKKV